VYFNKRWQQFNIFPKNKTIFSGRFSISHSSVDEDLREYDAVSLGIQSNKISP
jgi:hypothetical protein